MTWADVEAETAQIEAVLDRTAEVDRWCSGPDWILSVRHGFAPDSEGLLLRDDEAGPGYALLARYRLADGSTLVAGLEPLWGFAAPVFGPDLDRLARSLSRELHLVDWSTLVLPGVPPPSGPDAYASRLARALAPLGRLQAAEGIVRQVAHIGDGHRAWLARRSQRFRRNLSRAQRGAEAAGLVIIDAAADTDVFDRILDVEARSWKGRDGSGITTPEMTATYRTMTARLSRKGRLRVGVATLDGRDVGYILGGVRGDRYRGLQLSFVEEASELSVGHLLQAWQMAALEPEGLTTYDLGMDMAYKRRWADRAEPSLTLVIERT